MMPRDRTIALAKGLAAVIVWGASFVATKAALAELSPVAVVWLRFAIGVAVLGVAVRARNQLRLVSRRELLIFALLGLQGISFHQWLQSTALVTSQASTAGWIIAATPVFIAVLSALVLRERLGRWQIAGVLLATAGVLIVVSKGNLAALAAGSFGAPGDILIVISSPNWAVFSVLSRRVLRTHPAARVMFYVMTFGWLFSTVQFAATSSLGALAHVSPAGWLAIAFLGVFCSGLAYVFWFDALQHMPASQVGALLYLEPLVAQSVAAVALAEPVLVPTVAGGAVILLGVWLVNRQPRPATAAPPSEPRA
jgi:drug/metabolite transporter (DMT)-like permease